MGWLAKLFTREDVPMDIAEGLEERILDEGLTDVEEADIAEQEVAEARTDQAREAGFLPPGTG